MYFSPFPFSYQRVGRFAFRLSATFDRLGVSVNCRRRWRRTTRSRRFGKRSPCKELVGELREPERDGLDDLLGLIAVSHPERLRGVVDLLHELEEIDRVVARRPLHVA